MPRTPDAELVERLAGTAILEGLDRTVIERVARIGHQLIVPAGERVIDQGRMGRECYVILGGRAKVIRNGEVVTELGPGEIIGEMALIVHGPRTASVVAVDDLELLRIDADEFWELLNTAPELAERVRARLATRREQLESR